MGLTLAPPSRPLRGTGSALLGWECTTLQARVEVATGDIGMPLRLGDGDVEGLLVPAAPHAPGTPVHRVLLPASADPKRWVPEALEYLRRVDPERFGGCPGRRRDDGGDGLAGGRFGAGRDGVERYRSAEEVAADRLVRELEDELRETVTLIESELQGARARLEAARRASDGPDGWRRLIPAEGHERAEVVARVLVRLGFDDVALLDGNRDRRGGPCAGHLRFRHADELGVVGVCAPDDADLQTTIIRLQSQALRWAGQHGRAPERLWVITGAVQHPDPTATRRPLPPEVLDTSQRPAA